MWLHFKQIMTRMIMITNIGNKGRENFLMQSGSQLAHPCLNLSLKNRKGNPHPENIHIPAGTGDFQAPVEAPKKVLSTVVSCSSCPATALRDRALSSSG